MLRVLLNYANRKKLCGAECKGNGPTQCAVLAVCKGNVAKELAVVFARFALLNFLIGAVAVSAPDRLAPPLAVQDVHAPHNSLTLHVWAECAALDCVGRHDAYADAVAASAAVVAGAVFFTCAGPQCARNDVAGEVYFGGAWRVTSVAFFNTAKTGR